MGRGVRSAGAERTRKMCEKQCRCRYRQITLPSIDSLYIYYIAAAVFSAGPQNAAQIDETSSKRYYEKGEVSAVNECIVHK